MYVTRRLSMYQKDRSALSLPPPDGPDTGILVIQDIENDFKHCFGFRCPIFGSCLSFDITTGLPLPQNTVLEACNMNSWIYIQPIPVINKPLSAGVYYILNSGFGCQRGLAYTSSGAKSQYKFCFSCEAVHDFGPKPLDASNKHQQFYITRGGSGFRFKSLASDGHDPKRLQSLHRMSSEIKRSDFQLDDVSGLDHSLRGCLPEFDFPLSRGSSDAVVVGKWYCPFMFIKEKNVALPNQVTRSRFYEMTLKQQWVRIFSCSNCNDNSTAGDSIAFDVDVETEVVYVFGMENCQNAKVIDRIKWFEGLDKEGEAVPSVGLDRVIIEKIIRDQESFGWVRGKDKVKGVERFEGEAKEWKEFGCYMLVERYILRRHDKTLVLTWEFRHAHRIRCKWE
ncbi:hypothetical protein NC652_026906 [Populus alba x Populus x berolinensis]|nr:hypothetical protein NC652_026906 [Populus alba x Populus x berolinensis]